MSAEKADQFSPLGLYGDKALFAKRQQEGYTEVSFGGGPWIGEGRIVAIWVFYRPDGTQIATHESRKGYTPSGHTARGSNEQIMAAADFDKFVKDWQLTINPVRWPIAELLERVG